tara:strand:- start:179 stop:832 length:654 start_codon:yes stop_codon:yes gene_type:complete
MEVIRFDNEPAKTPTALHWDWFLIEEDLELDFNPLKDEILSKEKVIIDQYPEVTDTSAFGTKLGTMSLTARADKYNIFDFDSAAPLKEAVLLMHDKYIETLGTPNTDELYVHGWANVMRYMEIIQVHQHEIKSWIYLSGHLTLACNNTHTWYMNPHDMKDFGSKNNPGKMTIFPSWVPHGTDQVNKDGDVRVSVAFDILNKVGYENVDNKDMYCKLR